MQFLLTGYDGKDNDAPARRMAVRPEHLEKIKMLKKNGTVLYGGAILDENGNMIGSVILYEVQDRTALDELLKKEPYVIGGVWKKIDIVPFRLANLE